MYYASNPPQNPQKQKGFAAEFNYSSQWENSATKIEMLGFKNLYYRSISSQKNFSHANFLNPIHVANTVI